MEFSFNNKAIACIVVNGDPWFKAKEVATILAYTHTNKAITDHVDDDDKRKLVDLMGGSQSHMDYNDQKAIYINEPGMYSLILRSKMSKAKKFKKWAFADVLPSIRKHGRYETPATEILRIRNPTGETKMHYKVKKHIETTNPYVIISAG